MRICRILSLALFPLLLSCLAVAQSPDAQKYAPRPILLLSGENNVEAVMPMVFTVDGQPHLEFVPGSKIKESMDRGGQPIRLGDVLSALGQATQTISQLQTENSRLQTENDKLWKVAIKDVTPTVVVQPQPSAPQPQPAQNNALMKYMLLRSLLPQTHPYQLPMPVNPNANRLSTTCRTYTIGDMTHTECN